MRMRRALIAAVLLSCGGQPPAAWAGRWSWVSLNPPGSGIDMTLSGSGTAISGTGVRHREAGTGLSFTVSGSAAAGGGPTIAFHYADGTSETFTFGQPDANHLTLHDQYGTLTFLRQ